MTDIPRRAISRTVKLAGLPLGAAGRAAVGAGRRIGGEPAAAISSELQRRTAEQLFSVLGELKGGAMKVGQALSVLEGALPEELVEPYREALTKLQDSAPPMPEPSLRSVLAQSLGEDWERHFRSFAMAPAACASIGQVHRAIWSDGREVAVKVQYPGAGPALVGDFRRLALVARVSWGWLPGIDLGPLLDELIRRVEDELDYAREARHQQRFADTFAGDPLVVVPAVVHQAGAVLVTEWLDGESLSSIAATGDLARRRQAASAYLTFLLSGPQRARLLHADPHPGNFRLTADGRLGVLDFGAVDPLPDGLPAALGEILCCVLADDAAGLTDCLRQEGFVRQDAKADPARLLDLIAPFAEPLRGPEFTFTREWLRSLTARFAEPGRNTVQLGRQLHLPPKYLLIHRVWLGGIGVLCQLDAPVPAHRTVARWLPAFAPAAEDGQVHPGSRAGLPAATVEPR